MVETVSESRSQEMLKVFPCKFRYNSFSLDEGDGDETRIILLNILKSFLWSHVPQSLDLY